MGKKGIIGRKLKVIIIQNETGKKCLRSNFHFFSIYSFDHHHYQDNGGIFIEAIRNGGEISKLYLCMSCLQPHLQCMHFNEYA